MIITQNSAACQEERPEPVASDEVTPEQFQTLSGVHGVMDAFSRVDSGFRQELLQDYDALLLYQASVHVWAGCKSNTGYRLAPFVGQNGLKPLCPFKPRGNWFSRKAASPAEEAEYQQWFVRGIDALVDAFSSENIRFIGHTVRNIHSEVHDLYVRLRCQYRTGGVMFFSGILPGDTDLAEPLTREEISLELDEIVLHVEEYGSYWTSPEFAADSRDEAEEDLTDEVDMQDNEIDDEEGINSTEVWARIEKSKFESCLVDASKYARELPPDVDPVIKGIFDTGDKVALLGASKTKKTFTLIQLAMNVATGCDYLGLCIEKPRRTLLVQLEIKPEHFQRRIYRMAKASGLNPDSLRGQLLILNGRGLDMQWPELFKIIEGFVLGYGIELVIFDPLYKLVTGDENSAKDMKPILAGFDQLASKTGAAVLYSHHDAKGSPGDRDIRDRGAGSGVIGRDYDAAITLTPHVSEEDAVVVHFLCRNYRSPDGFAMRFKGGAFERANDLTTEVATSKKSRATPNRSDRWLDHTEEALQIASAQIWLVSALKRQFKKKFGLSDIQVNELYKSVRENEKIYTCRAPNNGTGPQYLIGLKEDVLSEKTRLDSGRAGSRGPWSPK